MTGTGEWSGISSTHSHDKHRCPQGRTTLVRTTRLS